MRQLNRELPKVDGTRNLAGTILFATEKRQNDKLIANIGMLKRDPAGKTGLRISPNPARNDPFERRNIRVTQVSEWIERKFMTMQLFGIPKRFRR